MSFKEVKFNSKKNLILKWAKTAQGTRSNLLGSNMMEEYEKKNNVHIFITRSLCSVTEIEESL